MKTSVGTLTNIQLLRAIAATLVIFVHMGSLLAPLGVAPFGGRGVDLFFVISGFIMVYTTNGRNITADIFIRNRISRVVPIYYLLTFAVFSIALITPGLLAATKPDTFQLIKSLLFIPFYKSNGAIQPILFVGWTLNYEMLFYVLFAFGPFFKSYENGFRFVLCILTILTIAGTVTSFENVFLRFYTSPMMLEFAFGMLIAIAFKRGLRLSSTYWKYILIGTLVLSIAALAGLPSIPGVGDLLIGEVPAALAVLAALGLESRGEFVRSTAVISMGDASYSMYLTHPFVTQFFNKISDYLHASGVLSVVLILICCITVFATAQIIHRIAERPLTNFVRHLLGTRRLKPSASVA